MPNSKLRAMAIALSRESEPLVTLKPHPQGIEEPVAIWLHYKRCEGAKKDEDDDDRQVPRRLGQQQHASDSTNPSRRERALPPNGCACNSALITALVAEGDASFENPDADRVKATINSGSCCALTLNAP